MITWIIIVVGAFIVLQLAAEIHFGKLTKAQALRGGSVILMTLLRIVGALLMLVYIVPILDRKAAAYGVSFWWIYLALFVAAVLITQIARHRKRQRPQ